MAVTISANHVNKSVVQIANDPTHLLSSGNGTSVKVVVGRPGSHPSNHRLIVQGSSNADCITAFETFMGINHDGLTQIF